MGEPLTPPDFLMPKLGPPLAALLCVILVVVAFLAIWIFGNDMRVGRALLVQMLGDGTKLTQSLLKADPKLPYYRIFSYNAYHLGSILSIGLIPLSLIGIWLARRATRLAQSDPAHFGGSSLAKISLVLSTGLLLIFSTVGITSIPGAIERGRAKRIASTRAMMYELHRLALQKYYKEYGVYPQDLSDLSRVNAESAPQQDYWQRNFNYLPISVIASKGSAISFSNYKLVSAGPDGKFATDDDILMVDGVIVSGQSEDDIPTTILVPEKPRQ
ncbi:MAG: hypothetical protein L0226_12445 [Acidobacteria bacterium]|nr:hypothetical protein [Acidobacteriota bacterium]